MTELWTPPQARTLPRAGVPSGVLEVPGVGRLHPGPDYVNGSLRAGTWSGPKRLHVLASLDATPHGDLLHVSLSYPDHDPPWRVIRAVRDAFYPASVDCMMVLPRAADYVDLHPFCFHIWQTPVGWGLQ